MKGMTLLLFGMVFIGLLTACIPTQTNAPEDMVPAETMEEEPTAPPLGFPGNPVKKNSDWELIIKDFDGVTMALAPVGCFTMGSNDGRDNERPAHEQCVEVPFWIDVYEVTREQFGEDFSGPDASHPVTYVNWPEAAAHCMDRGGRLPNELEWEYAARGPDGLTYPWRGEDVGLSHTTLGDSRSESPVGSKPLGISWIGALDMSGNVWEWTNSIFLPYPFDPQDGRETDGLSDADSPRVTRGGSYRTKNQGEFRAAFRRTTDPATSNEAVGFRCVLDY